MPVAMSFVCLFVEIHCQNLARDQVYSNLDCTIADALSVPRQVRPYE